MRLNRALAFVAFAVLAFAGVASAQDVLGYFPDDTFMVIGIDAHQFGELLPADIMEEMRNKSMEQYGADFFGMIDAMYFGFSSRMMMGDMSGMYGIMKGSVTADALAGAAMAKGEDLKTEQVGSLKAYYSEKSGQRGYIAQAGPDLLVAGMKEGLQAFTQITSGAMANASGNAKLAQAMGVIETNGLLFFAGYLTDDMKQQAAMQNPDFEKLETFGFVANYANEMLSMKLVLSAADASPLESIQMMMQQQFEGLKQMDPTGGALTEIVDNMQYKISGNSLVLTTGMSKTAVDSFFEMIKPYMQMGM